MKTSGTVALAAGSLLLLGAVWWLLREDERAPPRASLPRAAATPLAQEEGGPLHLSPDATRTAPELLEVPDVAPISASAPPAAAATEPLNLTLVHADGSAAAGAVVALVRDDTTPMRRLLALVHDETVLERRVTDASGRALFEGVDGDVVLAIGGVSDVPVAVRLEEGRGARTAVLPDGLVISGRVLVDGAPPTRPLLLGLSEAQELSDTHVQPKRDAPTVAVPAVAYDSLYASLPGEGWAHEFNRQIVGTDGRFEFSALPPGWDGGFDVTLRYYDGHSDDALRVSAPASDVLLDLTSTRTISGRVVDIGGAAPVPAARIAWELESGRTMRSGTFEADAEGRFSIPLAWYDDGFDRLALRIRHPARTSFRELTVTRTDPLPGDDLGDIELLPVRNLVFVVRDPDGAPVVGALALADDNSGVHSAPTDAAGTASLESLLHDTASMTVWAHRFFAQQVTLPPEAESGTVASPFVVVLQRSAALDVRVTLPGGRVAPAVNVIVGADRDLFASGARPGRASTFQPDDMVYEIGTSRSRGSMSGPARQADGGRAAVSGWASFLPDDEGAVSIGDLLPAVPLRLEVWSHHGELAWGPQTLTLLPGERRAVQVVLSNLPNDLVVRVTDVQGNPIEAAGVDASSGVHAEAASSDTDADGLATLRNLYAARLNVRVDRQGFAGTRVADVGVPRGAPLDVVLQAERRVRVFVHDARGRGVPADWVCALDGERILGCGDEVPPETGADAASGGDAPPDQGHWLIEGLSAGEVMLDARVGGRSFRKPHDTSTPDADILVPGTGALRVRWNFALDEGHEHQLIVHALGAPPEEHLAFSLSGKQLAEASALVPTVLTGDCEVALCRGWTLDSRCSQLARTTIAPDVTTEVTVVGP